VGEAVEAILAGEESSREEEDSKQEDVNARNRKAPPFSSNHPEFLALRPSPETDDGACPRSSNLPLETQQTDANQSSRHHSSRLVPLHEPDSHFDFDSDEDNYNLNSTDPDNDSKLPVPSRKTQRNQNVSTTEPLPRGPEQNPLVERPIKPTTQFLPV
jgi:hypothetical protein